jgi:hypothetical protein
MTPARLITTLVAVLIGTAAGLIVIAALCQIPF